MTRNPLPEGVPTSMRQLFVPRSSAAKAGDANRCSVILVSSAGSGPGVCLAIIVPLSSAHGGMGKRSVAELMPDGAKFTPRSVTLQFEPAFLRLYQRIDDLKQPGPGKRLGQKLARPGPERPPFERIAIEHGQDHERN